MRKTTWVITAVLTFSAAGAHAAPQVADDDIVVMRNPDWLKKPSFTNYQAVYPSKANGRDGGATIHCIVGTTGILKDCKVASETPPGLGFGDAVLAMAPSFLMKPALKDGKLVEAQVSIPVTFKGFGRYSSTGPSIALLNAPVWKRAPTTAEILALLDKKVGDKFAEGQVALQCTVNGKTGVVSDCVTLNTSPGMVQFQGVANSLNSKFQVDPETLKNITGRIKVNLRFSFPDMASDQWSKRYLTQPHWVRTIAPAAQEGAFPEAAVKAGLKTGAATVDCALAPDGSLTQCSVVSESNPNVGLGATAQRIAGVFVANPWTDDGLPADGAHVRVPVRMNYESTAEATAPTPPTKP